MSKHFSELLAWQKAHQLTKEVYGLIGTFPKVEGYNLTDQLRRAATSVPSNVAEAYGRYFKKEKIWFNSVALGSLMEVEYQLFLATELGYIKQQKYSELVKLITETRRLIKNLNHMSF